MPAKEPTLDPEKIEARLRVAVSETYRLGMGDRMLLRQVRFDIEKVCEDLFDAVLLMREPEAVPVEELVAEVFAGRDDDPPEAGDLNAILSDLTADSRPAPAPPPAPPAPPRRTRRPAPAR